MPQIQVCSNDLVFSKVYNKLIKPAHKILGKNLHYINSVASSSTTDVTISLNNVRPEIVVWDVQDCYVQ